MSHYDYVYIEYYLATNTLSRYSHIPSSLQVLVFCSKMQAISLRLSVFCSEGHTKSADIHTYFITITRVAESAVRATLQQEIHTPMPLRSTVFFSKGLTTVYENRRFCNDEHTTRDKAILIFHYDCAYSAVR